MFSSAGCEFPQAQLARFLERLANHRESLGLCIVFRHYEIGFYKQGWVEFASFNELLNLHDVARRNPQIRYLFRLNMDVLSFAVLVPFNNVAIFNGLGVRLGDFLMTDPLPDRKS